MKIQHYPFSPYHFNEIGVEILGSIYEKFLGKTIHLTPKTVRVDEKPEIRKAGGVYYTPRYIVSYIVDNTVGKLLYGERNPLQRRGDDEVVGVGQNDTPGHTPCTEGVSYGKSPLERGLQDVPSQLRLLLTPKQVAKPKIIDIACGSGSFLLGAFQKLIEYHIEWYRTHPRAYTIDSGCLLNTKYVLGLLNSSLLFWRLKQMSKIFRGGWITCTKQYFGELPIRTIDFTKPEEKKMHDDLVALVDKMLELHKQLQKTSFDSE